MPSRSRPLATPFTFSSSQRNNIEQETPHLSAAAYMRSLVKQLSRPSSSTARSNAEHLHAMSGSSASQDEQQRHAVKPEVKKQTRKRVPTSRPYQHRLHNMAEARREIVTALRIHRANMRHQQQHRPRVHNQVISQEQSQAFQGVPPPVDMSYASSSSNNHLSSSALSSLIGDANYSPSSSMLAYDLTPAAAIGGQLMEQLPKQPLGLNLSFQGFGDSLLDDANNSGDPFGVPLTVQSSWSCTAASSCSAAYSSSPVATAMAGHGGYSSAGAPPAASSHQVLDGEMLYSIGGERQVMELTDTAANAAAASAWWTKIFESMESGGGESAGAPPQRTAGAGVGTAGNPVVEAVGWPEWQWLCDGVELQQEVTAAGPKLDALETKHMVDGDCHEGDRPGDSGGGDMAFALPCVDIEGWDYGEWFS